MGQKIVTLLFFIAFVALTAAFGAIFTPGEWYASLLKPSWNPPAAVFGPVWSLLYILMAVAAWQVWESGHELRLKALKWWFIQLILNGAWSWLFFGLQRTGWALAEMTLLMAAIIMTIILFRSARPLAAILLVPYLAWVAFAWFLNLTLWRLNGGGMESILS